MVILTWHTQVPQLPWRAAQHMSAIPTHAWPAIIPPFVSRRAIMARCLDATLEKKEPKIEEIRSSSRNGGIIQEK